MSDFENIDDYDYDTCEACGSHRCGICGEMTCFGCSCDDIDNDTFICDRCGECLLIDYKNSDSYEEFGMTLCTICYEETKEEMR